MPPARRTSAIFRTTIARSNSTPLRPRPPAHGCAPRIGPCGDLADEFLEEGALLGAGTALQLQSDAETVLGRDLQLAGESARQGRLPRQDGLRQVGGLHPAQQRL